MDGSNLNSNANTDDTIQAQYDVEASKFAENMHGLIQQEKLLLGSPQVDKVVEFLQPAELLKVLDLTIGDKGVTNEELINKCKLILKYCVRTGKPTFFNQLYNGGDPYSLAAGWFVDATNTNEHTFEVAPAFVCITMTLVAKLNSIVGFPNGDGIFCAGGSMANMMAMSLARFKYNESIKEKGLFGLKRLVLFTSEDCHYSYAKGAVLLGYGLESLVKVKTDNRGCMSPDDLKLQIANEKKKGNVPIAVLATCGTTVMGAFDDLNALADVCKEHKLYLHADACWGGGVLFSKSKRHLLKGIERTDSLNISLHKMVGVTMQCCPLLVKEKGILEKCFGYKASYLFQPDKPYDSSYDLGDKTIMCGRKADAMKMWVMWKARGSDGMQAHVDRLFDTAKYFMEKIEKMPGFKLVFPEFQCTNICFWYIPPSLRGQKEDEAWWKKVGQVAPKIKARMQSEGSMLIGYQPLESKGFVNFFRIIFINPRVTYADVDKVIDNYERLGKDL